MTERDAIKKVLVDWQGRKYQLGKYDCVRFVNDYLSLLGRGVKLPKYKGEFDLNAKVVKKVLGRPNDGCFGGVAYTKGLMCIDLGYCLLSFSRDRGLWRMRVNENLQRVWRWNLPKENA